MDRLTSRKGLLPGLFGRSTTEPDIRNGGEKGTTASQRSSPFKRIPNKIRNHFVAMAGEFVGTFMFLFLAFAGTQVANTPATTAGSESTDLPQGPNPSQLLYISLAFGFSLAVNAWIFFRVSGGLFNPAVTLGLCLIGAVPWARGGLVFIAQMLGAMASAGVVKGLFPGPLAVTTSLGGTTSLAQGLFIEMFLTAQLIFTIFMLAAEKHKGTYLAPVGIGLSLFIAELAGVYYTGGSLNPARSFGPCVANTSFPSEHWIYWLGPVLGALVASGFYWFIKALEYEGANPGQDFDDLEASAFDPEQDLQRPVISPNAIAPERPVSQDLTMSSSREGRTGSRGFMSPHRPSQDGNKPRVDVDLPGSNLPNPGTVHDQTTTSRRAY
jgi:aquaporin rerated protein, other eukaryote